MRKWIICAASAMFLGACGTGGTASPDADRLSVPVEEMEKTEGFILETEDGGVLVNDVFYSLDENTHLVSLGNGSEKELPPDGLEEGMRVTACHSGSVALSLPARVYADVFVVHKDQEAAQQAEAFRAFLDAEEEKPLLINQAEFGQKKIRFDYTAVSNRGYRVVLDTDTHEYSKEPIEE